MKSGKLTPAELKTHVLSKLSSIKRNEVLLGAKSGEDCAVLKFEDLLFMTTDPITACSDPFLLGSLAVHVVANDLASSGAEPVSILLNILLPLTSDLNTLDRIIDGIADVAAKLNIEVMGGHTEFTDAVVRPVLTAAAVGIAKRGIATGNARPGDGIIITKNIALEGTAIIASDYANRLKGINQDELTEAKALMNQISVLPEGMIAKDYNVSSMHDITEGGVLGALDEICKASKTGCEIFADRIPVLAVTERICSQLDVDPLRLLSSGSMLIVSNECEKIISALNREGIQARQIGMITSGNQNIMYRNGIAETFEATRDEIGKLS